MNTQPLPEEWNLEDLCVSHGKVIHKINEKCDVCEKMYAEIPHVQRLISEAKREAVEECIKALPKKKEHKTQCVNPYEFCNICLFNEVIDQSLKLLKEVGK